MSHSRQMNICPEHLFSTFLAGFPFFFLLFLTTPSQKETQRHTTMKPLSNSEWVGDHKNCFFSIELCVTQTQTHAHTHTFTHSHTPTDKRAHTKTHTLSPSCTHKHTHTHTHTHVCMHTHSHTDKDTCTHTHTHTNTCMHACMCTHTHTHTHTELPIIGQEQQISVGEEGQVGKLGEDNKDKSDGEKQQRLCHAGCVQEHCGCNH